MPSRLTTPQPTNLGSVPVGWAGEAGNGSTGLPQAPRRGPCSPLGPSGCSPFQSKPSQVANSPFTPVEVFCIREGASRNLHPATRNSPSGVSASPYTPPPQPSTKHTPACAPPRISASPSPSQRRTPHRHTHILWLQSPGPRRSRSEYLVWPCSGNQKGRARCPPRGAERFSTHPLRWLLSFPGSGGRRDVGGEGEDEEPKGCRSRTGTTSTGPTLVLAQSTRALWIGQT